MQPAAYCYTRFSDVLLLQPPALLAPWYQPPMPVCQSFATSCLPVQLSQRCHYQLFSPVMSPQCGETQQQTAAAAGLDWAVTGSSATARLYRLLYTASDNYNEARCWENIMGGGLRSYSVL